MHDHLAPWRAARPATLAALAFALLWLSFSGRLAYYVHESQTWLVALAGLGLLGLLLVASRAGTGPHDHAAHDLASAPACCTSNRSRRASPVALAALALPVALALAPARPLGAAAALTLGVNDPGPARGADPGRLSPTFGTEHWTLLDWYRAWGRDLELQTLVGKRVGLEGFVLPAAPDEADGETSFRVARILITHCTADSQALALPVRAAGGPWQTDEWVRVEGTLAAARQERSTRPLVVAERVERIDPPPRPYLTP